MRCLKPQKIIRKYVKYLKCSEVKTKNIPFNIDGNIQSGKIPLLTSSYILISKMYQPKKPTQNKQGAEISE